MKKIAILFLALLLSGNGMLFGQGATTAEKLALSARLSEEFKRKKAEAVRVALEKGWPVRVEYSNGRIMEIMEIGPNGFPEYDVTNNINAARTTNTDDLWPGGSSGLNLTGNGFTIGEWDGGGVRTTHQEFRVGAGASRVTQMDGPVATSYHSTHVAGTMIAEGDVGSAHGMASEANLHAYEWNNDVAEMLNANAVDNIILSNHSYGRTRGWDFDGGGNAWWFGDTTISGIEDYQFGFYGPLTKTWDSMAYVMPDYLFVKSAGNDRNDNHTGGHYVYNPLTGGGTWSTSYRDPDGGADHYDCIENRASAKNLLTVGACLDIPGGWTAPANVVITDFSSYGPTDDGRIKPDIVANGDDLYSCSDVSNTFYEWLSGTSMSAPNVTGTLAALQQYYFTLNSSTYMMADELKALVINTANEAGTSDGPDYKFGYGLLNATAMAELIHLDDSLGNLIRRTTLANGTVDEFTYYSDGNSPINVTLCWTDPAHAALAPSLNPTTACLVHDLDVRIITPSGGTAYPWRLNPFSPSSAATRNDNYRDNLEKITIDSPPAGQYTIRITHKSAIATQYYALVISGLQTQRYTNYWTGGATSDYWYLNDNWSLGHDPVIDEEAEIPAGSSFHAIVDVADGVCYSLNVGNDAWLEIRDDSLTIEQDLSMYGLLEMDNDAGRLIIGDDARWFSGSSADIQAANTQIWVYGDWWFYSGTNVNITGGIVDFAGTGISYLYSYDNDAAFNKFGDYKTGGGYVEHNSASTQPLRTNDLFYLHFNSEFRSTTSQPIIIKGYFSKTSSATCNLTNGTIVMDGTATNIYFDPPGNFYNLTISPSTSITLQDDINVDGDLLIEQGSLIAGNHKINIAGDWTNTVGDAGFNETGSRVIFDVGDGDSYILSGENFDTLDVSVFSQLLMVNLTPALVTCDHFIHSYGWVNVENSTFTAEDLVQNGVYGVWVANSGGVINLYQDAAQFIDIDGSLTIDGGEIHIFGGSDDSYLGYLSDNYITMSSGILDFVNRGVRIWDDYALTENITGGTIRTAERFNVDRADFNPTGGTIEFNSSALAYISHYAGSNFYNILINKSSKGADLSGDDFMIPEDRMARDREPGIMGDTRKNKLLRKPPSQSRSSLVILESNLDINGDLTISNGVLDVSISNYSINIAGNWTNNVDLTGFNERNGTVTFDGALAKDLITGETFYNLVMDKTYVGAYALEITTGNIVYVINNLNVNDGTLRINSNSILDISGNLTIATGGSLNAADVNTSLRIEGNFTDNNATFSTVLGFYAGYYSTVLFYGTSDQLFSTAGTSMIFNNLTIDKATSVFLTNENLELRGDLSVLTGTFQDNTATLVHSFRGDFTINPGANFYETTGGVCKFIGSADQVITFDPVTTDGYFYNLTVDKSVAMQGEPGGKGDRANLVTMATDIISLVEGNLTVNYGTLDFNGNYFRALGDVKIYSGGKILIDDDAWLEVGGSDSLIVFTGGTLEVVGSAGHEAKVKSHSAYHAFEIRSGGTISAKHAIFEGTGSAGLYVQSGGLINATNDFDYCTFQNGQAAAAALLRIDNNQTITVDSAYFPTSTTNKNVSKTLNQGNVTFTGATGAFAGPLYEDDANGRIHWTEFGQWDGSESTNWNTIGNWGFDILPTVTIDVVIPAGCPNYPLLSGNLGINTDSYTYDCKSLNVQAGGRLTISGAYRIYNFGNISSNGDLDIGDDYFGYNLSELNITGDTARFGNGTSNSVFLLNSGSVVNQTGGHLMAEGYTISSGSQFNGTGGKTHLSLFGTAPATQNVVINDPDSYFETFMIDEGVTGSMSTSLEDIECNNCLVIAGTFNNFGKIATTHDMIVYGTLAIDSGLISVANYGPWFWENSNLNMTGGTLDGGNDFIWFYGSSGSASGGTIYGGETWQFEAGCNVQLGAGNTVFFNDPVFTWIFCYSDNASFGTVEFDKPAGNGGAITMASPYPMEVAGDFVINSGNEFSLQSRDLNIQGELVNEAGSLVYMSAGADLMNNLDFTLNGTLYNSGGNMLIHGTFLESPSGILTMSGGSFIVDKAISSLMEMNGTLNLSNGILEMTHNGLLFNTTFIDNITGGTIRVGSTLFASNNVFQPSGNNTVELINFSGAGWPYIQQGTGNWFRNLNVNSNIQWYIGGGGASQLDVQQDLTINSGGLIGSDDLVYIGDDWTNNAGTGGFVYGTGSVYLNGTSPTPERQVISGTTTFYNLINSNINAVVEFAGPITINNIYNAGSGGAACYTLVTGSPVNIQNQLNLSQGSFALSSSAPVVTAGSLIQGGSIQVTNGSFTANDLAESFIKGAYILYNGQINLNQDPVQFLDLNANLTIHGGELNVDGGTDESYWPFNGSGSLTMDGGVLDFKSVGIHPFSNSFTENITGGLIKTVGRFYSNAGVTFFTPEGGAVEMYGDNNTQILLQTGCYFHDLYISKNPPAMVNPLSDLLIKSELKVKSSEFQTDGFLIHVGD